MSEDSQAHQIPISAGVSAQNTWKNLTEQKTVPAGHVGEPPQRAHGNIVGLSRITGPTLIRASKSCGLCKDMSQHRVVQMTKGQVVDDMKILPQEPQHRVEQAVDMLGTSMPHCVAVTS